MKKNFFDLVNPSFFTIFNSKYREINYDILTIINDEMQHQNGQLDKERIVELISTYFLENPNILKDDQEEIIEFKKDPYRLVKDYEKYGWLIPEVTADFKVVYQFDEVAIQILNSMQDAVNNDIRPLESTGYVHSIYKLSKDFDPSSATGEAEQLLSLKKSLDINLRMVNSRIKKYLNNLLKEDNQYPNKILKELLINYQENVVAKSFNNLRKKDNPAKYKDEIISNIKYLKNYKMDELIDNYIQTKLNGKHTEDNERTARWFFIDIFNQIIDAFKTINEKIDVLDSKNSQYVSSARARLSFLLNDKDNLEGRIDRILKSIEDINDIQEIELDIDDFELFDLGHIDDSSLYIYQKSDKAEESVATIDKPQVTEEEKLRFKQQLERLNNFTIKGVDNFILSKLGENKEVTLDEIKIDNLDEFMMLFLGRIYSSSKIIHYEILPADGSISYNGNEIENYKIRRKK